jgi:hypothetical protein
MTATIQSVPHAKHRYPTVGDWMIGGDGAIIINVSATGNPDYDFLVGVHELIEAYLCLRRGISQESVDSFDMNIEKAHQKALTFSAYEPGDHPDAPYRREHCTATGVERILAAELNVNWHEYETALNSL